MQYNETSQQEQQSSVINLTRCDFNNNRRQPQQKLNDTLSALKNDALRTILAQKRDGKFQARARHVWLFF